jgi:hypothetical protein
MNPNVLLPEGYRVPENIAIYSNDVNSPMIPHTQYRIDNRKLTNSLEERLNGNEHAPKLLASIQIPESDLVTGVEFKGANATSYGLRYLYLTEELKEDLSGKEWRELSLHLDNSGMKFQGDSFTTFTQSLLDEHVIEKGMTLEGDFIAINEYTSEEELVEAFFEMYPANKVGGLIKQLLDEGAFPDKAHLLEATLPNMFAKRVRHLDEVDALRYKMLPAAGIDPFTHKDDGRYVLAMRSLWEDLSHQNPVVVAKGVANVCEDIDRGIEQTSEDMAIRLSDMGVMVTDKLLESLERCIEAAPLKKANYLEMKVEGACELNAISHIVVPEAMGAEIGKILNDAGLDLPVEVTAGANKLDAKWQRVVATVDAPIEQISLMDRSGFRVEPENGHQSPKMRL